MKTIVVSCSICDGGHVRFMATHKIDPAAPGVYAAWLDRQVTAFEAHNATDHQGKAELSIKQGPYG